MGVGVGLPTARCHADGHVEAETLDEALDVAAEAEVEEEAEGFPRDVLSTVRRRATSCKRDISLSSRLIAIRVGR